MTNAYQQKEDDFLAMNWLKIAAPALAVWYTDTFLLGLGMFVAMKLVTSAAVWIALLRFNVEPMGRAVSHIHTLICVLAFVLLNAFGTNGWVY